MFHINSIQYHLKPRRIQHNLHYHLVKNDRHMMRMRRRRCQLSTAGFKLFLYNFFVFCIRYVCGILKFNYVLKHQLVLVRCTCRRRRFAVRHPRYSRDLNISLYHQLYN